MNALHRSGSSRRDVLLTLVLAAAVVAAIAIAPASVTAGDSATILRFDPEETDADPGETVTVDVTMHDHGDLYGNGVAEFEFTVAYDADVLTLTDVDHDPWLDDGTADVETTRDVDDDAGTVTLGEEREPPGDGVTGSGAVATLTFSVADDADPTDAALSFEGTTVILASDYPRGVLDRGGTIYVDGGVEPADDGDDPGAADDGTTDGADAETIPGFGVVVAVAAVALLLVLGRTER